jgi:hypothetical protein
MSDSDLSPLASTSQNDQPGSEAEPDDAFAASDNKRARNAVVHGVTSPDLIETVYQIIRKHKVPMKISDTIKNIGMPASQIVFDLKFLTAKGALQSTQVGCVIV